MVNKKKNPLIIYVRVGYKNPPLKITIGHRSASLVMPNSNPLDRFFLSHPHTHMMDSWVKTQKGLLHGMGN